MNTDTEPNTQYDSPHVDLELQNPDLMMSVTDEFLPPVPWGRLVSNHSSVAPIMLMDQDPNADGRRNSYLLGRSPQCQIKFDSIRVSNRHCNIFCKENKVDPARPYLEAWIEDMSANGTFINKDTRLKKNVPRLLRNADVVYLINPDFVRLASGSVTQEEINKNSFVVMLDFQVKAPAVKTTLSRALNEAMATRTSTVITMLNQNRILQDHYELKELLGTGTSGRVYLGIHKETGSSWAVKTIDTRKIESQENLTKEAEMLRSLRHPNIIHLEDIFADDKNIHLIMELSDGGDLFDRISFKGHYDEADARLVIRQILEAIKYLHDKKISHRDLKPENILLVRRDSDVDVKITDFGLAKKLDDQTTGFKSYCGTPQYFAPEVLQRKNTVQKQGVYSFEADMWSVGVISYVMLSGTFPFHEKVLFQQIKKADYNFNASAWRKVSNEAKQFIQRLLLVNARDRLTAGQALADPWISGSSSSNGGAVEQLQSSGGSGTYGSQGSYNSQPFSDSQSPQQSKMVPPAPGKRKPPAANKKQSQSPATAGIAAVGGIDQYFNKMVMSPGANGGTNAAIVTQDPSEENGVANGNSSSSRVGSRRTASRSTAATASGKPPSGPRVIYSLDSVPPSEGSSMEVVDGGSTGGASSVVDGETVPLLKKMSVVEESVRGEEQGQEEEAVMTTPNVSRKRATRSTTTASTAAPAGENGAAKRKKTK